MINNYYTGNTKLGSTDTFVYKSKDRIKNKEKIKVCVDQYYI